MIESLTLKTFNESKITIEDQELTNEERKRLNSPLPIEKIKIKEALTYYN